MKLPWFQQKNAIGIDISSTAVKLLEFSHVKNGYMIESYAVEPLPESTVVEKEIKNIESVAEAVRRCVKRSGTRSRQVVIAVPDQSVISKRIPLPRHLDEYEIEETILAESDQHIPYPIDEVAIDFEVLGPWSRDPGMNQVQLVAAKKTQLEDRLNVVRAAGLKPLVADVESYCYEHILPLLQNNTEQTLPETVAVIDVGATTTVFGVLEDGHLIYTRSINFGGKQLTDDIMRQYGMSYQDAGRAKRDGSLPSDYKHLVLHPFLNSMATQVNRAIQIYLSTGDGTDITQIYLAGGCANISNVDTVVADQTGIPCQIIDLLKAIHCSNHVQHEALERDSPSLIVAAGLAMRGVT